MLGLLECVMLGYRRPWRYVRGLHARSLATVDIAASETTRSLLSQIQGEDKDGVLQSCTGGLLRVWLGAEYIVRESVYVHFHASHRLFVGELQ